MTLGGRAAEELVFDEVTTGAANDLEKVTAHGQGHDHALRHEREARPAHVRPQPRPAVPRPRVLAGARLLRGDRARDRRRDPPHRRGGAPARQDGARRARRDAAPPLQDPARARDDRPRRSSCGCSTARTRKRSSRRRARRARARSRSRRPRRSAASSRGCRASRASPTLSPAARRPLVRVAPLAERYPRGALVGVLNVTPDSFSDGGDFPASRPRSRTGAGWRRGRGDRRRRRRVDAPGSRARARGGRARARAAGDRGARGRRHRRLDRHQQGRGRAGRAGRRRRARQRRDGAARRSARWPRSWPTPAPTCA